MPETTWAPIRRRTPDGAVYQGPDDIEAGMRTCECGWTVPWDDYRIHEASDFHLDRMIAQMDWVDFRDVIANGLGWAESEGQGMGDHALVLRVIDRLIAERTNA